ncbi:MAG: RNA 2',3'-cyclic phosphodiesterase [Deltaproteobacteria bacterium]
MLRTFIAVKIAQTIELRRLHERLAKLGDRFRPVALDNLHVTLKFLGDTSPAQVPEVCAIAKRVVEGQPAVVVRLSGVGAFPNARRPSVVWVGLEHSETLGRIAGALDRDLAPLGFAREGREFQPHLTLMRIKSRPPEDLFALLSEEAATDFGTVPIDEVEFLKSELTPGGSRYTRLATFSLPRRDS